MLGVVATLERLRDEWINMAMELREMQFNLDSPERQAAIEKADELITKIKPS